MADERDTQRTEIKAAWSEAGERLSGLGAKLKHHYAEQQGTEPEQAGTEVKEAVKRLGDAVQDAFEAIGAAAKDTEVKQDVREVGQSVASALGATFSGLGDELRRAFDSTKGQARTTGEAPYGTPDAASTSEDRPYEAGDPSAPAPTPDRPPVQDAPTIVDPPITMEEPPPASPEANR